MHSWVQKMTIKEQIFVNQILVPRSRARDAAAGGLQGRPPEKQWRGRGPDKTITATFSSVPGESVTGAASSGRSVCSSMEAEGTIKQRKAAFKRTNLSVDVLPPNDAVSCFLFCLASKIHTQLESFPNIDYTDSRIHLYGTQKSQVT